MAKIENFDDIETESLPAIGLRKDGVIYFFKRRNDFKFTGFVFLAYSKRNKAIVIKFVDTKIPGYCYKISDSRITVPCFFSDHNIIYEVGKYEAVYKRITRLGMCWVVYLDRKVDNEG